MTRVVNLQCVVQCFHYLQIYCDAAIRVIKRTLYSEKDMDSFNAEYS